MTKEEIKEQLLSQNHTISNPVYGYGQVMKSMDDYAKQQVAAFDKWRVLNEYKYNYVHELWSSYRGLFYTTEQLYSLFLEQK